MKIISTAILPMLSVIMLCILLSFSSMSQAQALAVYTVVYTFEGPGAERSIFSVNSDGSNWQELTDDGTQPVWSPDGSRIAYVSERDGNPEIYVMNADGSDQQRLTTNSFVDYQPSWSPDGAQLAFASSEVLHGRLDIYILDVATGTRRNITNHPAQDYDPA